MRPFVHAGHLLALALALAGCASTPAADLKDELKAVKPARVASPYRLALAPIEVDPAAALRPGDEAERWSPVKVGRVQLREDFLAAIKASNAFADVGMLEIQHKDAAGAEATTPPLDNRAVFRVDRPLDNVAVMDAAFTQHVDLVCTVTVKRHAVRYAGRNSWFVPNLINFFCWIWTAWFVADEEYAGDMEVEAVVRAVGSERVIFRETFKGSGEPKDLNHFDRGWSFAGVITTPGWLTIENYERAGDVVLPHARNEIATAFARRLAEERDPALKTEPRNPLKPEMPSPKDLAHVRALCVGVGRYANANLQDLRVATDDAKAFASLLVTPERGGVAGRNVSLLTDREDRQDTLPVKARIVAGLTERARDLRGEDTLYFYFAGYGFEAGGGLFLAPNDLDPKRPTATALSLDEVASALAGCKARQVVILDTSFGGSGEEQPGKKMRTLPPSLLVGLPPSVAGPGPEERVRAALERFAKGRVVIVAAEPGAPATEQSPIAADKKGLLTARLCDAAAADEADIDRDGLLTLLEVFAKAKAEAQRLSTRAGLTQVPLLLDPKGAAKGIALAKAPGTAKKKAEGTRPGTEKGRR